MNAQFCLNGPAVFYAMAAPQGHRLEPDEIKSHNFPVTCHAVEAWGSTRDGAFFSMNERKWKRGDIGPDGRVFAMYHKECKNGERWVTPEKFEEIRERDRLSAKSRRDREPEKYRIRDRERRYNNAEIFRSMGKQRYALNAEKFKLRERERYSRDPEKKRREKRECRARKPDVYRKIEAERRARDPERSAAHNRQNKARRRSNTCDHVGVTANKWRSIKLKSGGRCHYCQKKCKLTMDHVIPISKGGKHDPLNVVPACGSCNSRKKDKSPEQFARSIGRLLI